MIEHAALRVVYILYSPLSFRGRSQQLSKNKIKVPAWPKLTTDLLNKVQ